VVGLGAGAAATLASGISNWGLSLLVSDEQKRREHLIRRGSPHQIGGALLLQRVRGRKPSLAGRFVATIACNVMYSAIMGLAYTAVRRILPASTRPPFTPLTAASFFVACDGVIAPALRLTPHLTRLPWQFNAKELVNHIVWNVTAERIHRADERALSSSVAR
jgi:hypothetical protein